MKVKELIEMVSRDEGMYIIGKKKVGKKRCVKVFSP